MHLGGFGEGGNVYEFPDQPRSTSMPEHSLVIFACNQCETMKIKAKAKLKKMDCFVLILNSGRCAVC